MLIRLLFLALQIVLLSNLSHAQLLGQSAYRDHHESWQKAAERNSLPQFFRIKDPVDSNKSVYDSAEKYDDLNKNSIPEYSGRYEDLEGLFKQFRDLRYLNDPKIPDFLRRISWLYPDDGCFARAQNLGLLIQSLPLQFKFSKMFIFGNLYAATKNNPNGYVTWWYHVAVTFRMGTEVFIFDPSLSPDRPLLLEDWSKLMVNDPAQLPNLKYSICHASSYVPGSLCNGDGVNLNQESVRSQLNSYLRAERSRLNSLGRDADQELGDRPPWL